MMFNPKPIRPSDTVFLGDSLTESFDVMKFFGRSDLHNRGMSGNMTDHVIYRLEEMTNAKPAILFLMIGINDLYQGVPVKNVFSNIKEILSSFSKTTPDTKIFVQSVLPVNEASLFMEENLNLYIYELNTLLKDHCRKQSLNYIDLHSEFLNRSGQMDSKYTYDGVHLTKEGYVLWAEVISDFLK